MTVAIQVRGRDTEGKNQFGNSCDIGGRCRIEPGRGERDGGGRGGDRMRRQHSNKQTRRDPCAHARTP